MRGLLKKCFSSANPFFLLSFIPFEIWRDNIISKADDRGVICISQTCKGFKWLVDNLRERLLEHALKYRREDQIPQARDTIQRCAAIGNSRAMFHIGYVYRYNSGWGLTRRDHSEDHSEWFKKSAKCGNAAGMAYYAIYLLYNRDPNQARIWAKKALGKYVVIAEIVIVEIVEIHTLCIVSNDPLAIGLCYYFGLEIPESK